MNRLIAVAVVAVSLVGGSARAGVTTEWRVRAGDYPFQVGASATAVYFTAHQPLSAVGAVSRIGDTMTMWSANRRATNPGAIEAHPTNGLVYVTDLSEPISYVLELDPATGNVRRWAVPFGLVGGPRNFGFDSVGRVVFNAWDTTSGAALGRLDPVTSEISIWSVPAALGSRSGSCGDVVVGANDEYFLAGGANQWIVRLDPTTGTYTSWPVPAFPTWGIAQHPDGSLMFREMGGWPMRATARLQPASNELTEWLHPGVGNDAERAAMLPSGVFAWGDDSLNGIAPLDARKPGSVTTTVTATDHGPLSPRTRIVTPSFENWPATVTTAPRSARGFSTSASGYLDLAQLGLVRYITSDRASGLCYSLPYQDIVGCTSFELSLSVAFDRVVARWQGSASVEVRFRTLRENGSVRFALERGLDRSGPFTIVGGTVPAAGSGTDYLLTDATASPGSWYRVVEHTASGRGDASAAVAPSSTAAGRRIRSKADTR